MRRAPALLVVTPRRTRRRFGGAVWSLLAHLGLIALLLWTIDRDFATVVERGSPLTPQRGGGGGGGGEFVALPALPAPAPRPATPPVAQPPQTVPVQTVPVTIPEPIPPPADTTPPTPPASTAAPTGAAGTTGPGTGGGTGGGAGTGIGPGNGAGTGPGDGNGGAGGHGRHAEPKRQVMPPMESAPKELRGRPISVTYWVGQDGKVLRFEVRPEIEDKGYAKKFAEAMREQEFKPARGQDGKPVPDSVTFTWIIN